MKTPQVLFFLLTLFTTIHAFTLPASFQEASHLFKRKGGGGGGGRGGGGFSSSGGSRGSSGGSRGGSSGGRAGVGPQPRTYASGNSYYGGGAAAPFRTGRRSPGGINPVIVPAAGVGFLGAGALAYGAYSFYPYGGYWHYYNRTAGENQTHPAQCYCRPYSQCGCDARNETDYVNSVANNQSIAQVADVNGTDTLLVNGTLPNGTVVAQENAAAALNAMGVMGGWAVLGSAVAWGVWLL